MPSLGISLSLAMARGYGSGSGSSYDPYIATGTYTGTGIASVQSVALDFEPDYVMVSASGQYPCWKNFWDWYGKSQFFITRISEKALGPYSYQPVLNYNESFRGNGFNVTGVGNVVSTTYHYLAIKDNGSGMMQAMSWYGNATSGRNLSWTNTRPNGVFIKRDNAQNAVWRWDGFSTTVSSGYLDGTSTSWISAINNDGITVGSDGRVNQLTDLLGEGISGISWKDSDTFAVVEWTGDGTTNRLISTPFQPCAAFILDTINTGAGTAYRQGILTNTMPNGTVHYMDNTAAATGLVGTVSSNGLEAGGIRLNAGYNTSARTYAAYVFKANTPSVAYTPPAPVLTSRTKAVQLASGGYISLSNVPTLNDAMPYTLEWYGRIRWKEDYEQLSSDPTSYGRRHQWLFMIGQGSNDGTHAASAGEYNAGLYVYELDPENLDGDAPAFKFLQGDYCQSTRVESDIRYADVDTGIIPSNGEDYHVMLTYDGAHHWVLYANGKPIKDYAFDRTTVSRNNGPAGTSKPGILGSYLNDAGTPSGVEARCAVYRAAMWVDTELTAAQVANRYAAALDIGTSYTGPAVTKEWDFMGNGSATDASITSGTVVNRNILSDRLAAIPTIGNWQSNDGGSFSYTPSAGSNAKLVVHVTQKDLGNNQPITGVTFGGVAMTALGSAVSVGTTNIGWAQTYYLDNPGTSAGTIAVTGGESVGLVAYTLTGSSAITGEVTGSGTQEAGGTLTSNFAYSSPYNTPALYVSVFHSGATTSLTLGSSSRYTGYNTPLQSTNISVNSTARMGVYAMRVEPRFEALTNITNGGTRYAMQQVAWILSSQ